MLDISIGMHVVGMALLHFAWKYWPIGVRLVRHFRGIDLGLTPLSCIDSFLIERMVHIALHADPLSKSSIARMKHWIVRCDTNDAKCKVEETPLPTRVLDVRDQEDIRLCETGGQSSAYIALSHCWGSSDKTFITTHETIPNMKAGFKIKQAPATFHNAISITRLLGFRYLWIDSLCIIQDDSADWSREAARMGSVYANAYLTIAATNAKDDNDGFLQLRSHTLTSLRIVSSTGNLAQVYLQTQYDGNNVRAHIAEAPLDTRGWALQEQRLSCRSLRFGSKEMSWDCQCISWVESQADHWERMCNAMESLKPLSTASGTLSYYNWYEMAFSFTARQLTYDTDKLPALSGLATEVAKFRGGTYCAGLWWEDMAWGLLWYKRTGFELTKPSEYLAPSWSWASLNGGTLYPWQWPEKITLPDVVFREYYLEYKSDDPYGAIKSGWLDLSAPVVKLVRREHEYSPLDDNGGLHRALGFAHSDIPDIEMNDRGDDVGQLPFRRSTKGNYETRGLLDLAHKHRTEIFGLFLKFSHDKAGFSVNDEDRISSQTAQQDSLHWSSLYGILVECSPKRLPCKRLPFKRVGFFESVRLEAREALQILKGAEVQDIRLY